MDYSRGHSSQRNGDRGAVTNATRVLVTGHWGTWKEVSRGEGLEGQAQGVKKPGMFEEFQVKR